MLREALHKFPSQFAFKPEMRNPENFKRRDKFVVCGMGGSHLSADLLKIWKPGLDIIIHEDYGLPEVDEKGLRERLIILSSYSGNTEEVIDAFHAAQERKLAMVAISIGGKLLELAQEHVLPYIQMPDTGIQPRMALGFSLKAMLAAIGDEEGLHEASRAAEVLRSEDFEKEGMALAAELEGSVPVIYASRRNYGIAYGWKIKFNETGKIPAFCNVIPELNHNEMNGFDVISATAALSSNFHFIFLRDGADDEKNQKRMEIVQGLYRDRGLWGKSIAVAGDDALQKIFGSLFLADWTAYYIAGRYGLEAEQVPMVEEFKRLMSGKR